jgi:hypothetical protein
MLKIIFSVIVILLFFFYWRFFERRSIFYPAKIIEFDPSSVGLEYEEVLFKARDGIELHGWFIPKANAYATVLYCHGNAGNISHRLEIAKMFYDKNMGFFIFDYRGFGRSKGTPGEQGTYLDAQAAYDYLVKTKGIEPEKIVIYGKSLGAAIAIDLAAKVKAAALISESGFTSTPDLAREVYKFLPLWLLVSQKYDSLKKIDKINMPKLIIHSQNDEIIPFRHGKRLFDQAREPKELYPMQGGHNDAFYIHSDECMQRIDNFLKKYIR